MTHEELIAKAREHIEKLERAAKDHVRPPQIPKIDALPKVRVQEAAVVYFESDQDVGRIMVVLDRETGAMITASLSPPASGQKRGVSLEG